MIVHEMRTVNSSGKRYRSGSGVVNSLINKLPIELHIPGYQFCGPGTKLSKRLARGDKGINPLDEACREHDIAYSKFKDISQRNEADKILAGHATARLSARDSSFGEKAAALGVAGAMKIKTSMGMGLKSRKRGRGISFREAINQVKKQLKRTSPNLDLLKASRRALKSIKSKKVIHPKRRIIPIPKTGGFLPLIPIFAALSALGALGGGAGAIAKAVNDAKSAKQQLDETQRHNKTMESIAMGKGMYLKPYKKGLGLFLKPYSKNQC